MADADGLAVAVLAAGQSRRFGETDKLRASFRDKPLGLHVTDTLTSLHAAVRIVVASKVDHVCSSGWRDAGFSVVGNPSAEEGMGTSVAVAARIARRAGATTLLIALADMPLVPKSHFRALVAAGLASGPDAIVASSAGDMRMPPAVFGSSHFDALAELCEDEGALHLLAGAETITCQPDWLADVDTPEELAAIE